MGCASSKPDDSVSSQTGNKPASSSTGATERSSSKPEQVPSSSEPKAPVAVPSDQAPATATVDAAALNGAASAEPSATAAAAAPSTITITPHAGFVIKSRSTKGTHTKMFVNVLHHKAVKEVAQGKTQGKGQSAFITSDAQWATDKKGEQCMVYAVVIPSKLLKSCSIDEDKQYETSLAILNLLNTTYPHANLDLDFKLPKINRGFMGETIESITIDASTVRGASLSTASADSGEAGPPSSSAAASAPPATPTATTTAAHDETAPATTATGSAPPAAPTPADEADTANATSASATSASAAPAAAASSLPPPLMKGWLRKQGHIVRNWKERYFVLDGGVLSYYVESCDSEQGPEYGKGLKGQVCVAGYKATCPAPAVSGDEAGRSLALAFDAEAAKNLSVEVRRTQQEQQQGAGKGRRGSALKAFEELHLLAGAPEEKDAWLAALSAHIQFLQQKQGGAVTVLQLPADEDQEEVAEKGKEAEEEEEEQKPGTAEFADPSAAAEAATAAASATAAADAAAAEKAAAEKAATEKAAAEEVAAIQKAAEARKAAEEAEAARKQAEEAEAARKAAEEETAESARKAAAEAEEAARKAATEAEEAARKAAAEAEEAERAAEESAAKEKAAAAETAAAEKAAADAAVAQQAAEAVAAGAAEVGAPADAVDSEGDDSGGEEGSSAVGGAASTTAGAGASADDAPRLGDRKPSVATIRAAHDFGRFNKLLQPGEELARMGLMGKPNPVGMQWMRQLILTRPKRLIYCEPKSVKQKGQIEWKSSEAHPVLKVVDDFTFEVVDCRGKVYRFVCKEDSDSAKAWVDAINDVSPPPA